VCHGVAGLRCEGACVDLLEMMELWLRLWWWIVNCGCVVGQRVTRAFCLDYGRSENFMRAGRIRYSSCGPFMWPVLNS